MRLHTNSRVAINMATTKLTSQAAKRRGPKILIIGSTLEISGEPAEVMVKVTETKGQHAGIKRRG